MPDYAEALEVRTSDPDTRFNNALARGLAILRCFQLDDRMMGNAEIAERTGIPKPTVSRLTFTLTTLGYLRYRAEFGQYELAAGVVGLAYPYLVNEPVPPVARPLMQRLALESKSNVGLGVQDGLSVLYLEYALGEATMNRRQRVGFRVPLVRTAMGRACIAAMTPGGRDEVFRRIAEYYPDEWRDIRAGVDDAVAHVQSHGWCTAVRTFERSTATVAVPFVHPDGRSVMAFNASANVAHHTPARLARTGRLLLELTDEVRRQLAAGGRGPSLGRA